MRPALKKRGSEDKPEEAFVRSSGVIRTRPAGRGCFAASERLRRRRSGTSGTARQSGSCRIGPWVSSAGRRKASPTPRTGAWKCRRVENPARPRCARPPSEAVAAAHRQTRPSSEDGRARGNGERPSQADADGCGLPITTDQHVRRRQSLAGREPAITVLSAASRPRVRCRADRIQVAVARAGPGTRCDPDLKAGRCRPRPPPQAEWSDRSARLRRGTLMLTAPRAAAHGFAQESACDPASERRIAPTSPVCQEWGRGGFLIRDQGSGPDGVPRPQFLQASHPSEACRPLSGTPCSRRKLE